MKNFFSKLTFIFFTLTSICYAKEKQVQDHQIIQPANTQCEKPCSNWSVVEDEAPANCGYNCPARINPACGWDFNIYGDFLYWQAREKNLAPLFHIQASQPSAAESNLIQTNQDFDFDYHPAFKVGIGAAAERDNWTYNLEYTRFHASYSKNGVISSQDFNPISTSFSQNYFSSPTIILNAATSLINLLHPIISSNNGFFAKSFDSHWKLNFNIIDLITGRPYFLGTKLTLSPFYGLRGGWIDQRYTLNSIIPFSTATPATPIADYAIYFSAKSNSWLLGPRVGVNSNWLIGAGFRIFGDAGASLVYQNFKTKIKNIIPVQNAISVEIKDTFSQKTRSFNPTFDAALGLGWGSYFNNKRWHFDFTAGYEFQFFYAQNELLGEILVSRDAESLILQGLTLSAKFDF